MLIEIDHRELATILAALRYWQQELETSKTPVEHAYNLMDHFDEEKGITPLDPVEIDELCEHINCNHMEETPAKYNILAILDGEEYELHGPFATELEQAEKAVELSKVINRKKDLLLFVDSRGAVNLGFVPGDFLDDPEPELTRLRAQLEEGEDELAAKIRRYLNSKGVNCLHCGDTDIVGDSYEHEEGYVTQDVTCSACGKSWRDTLTLTSVTPLED